MRHWFGILGLCGLLSACESPRLHVEFYAMYGKEAALLVDELRDAPEDLTVDEWTERHAHGRRWVVARAGTYLVDRALRASGKSASELATTPTAAILSWAQAR